MTENSLPDTVGQKLVRNIEKVVVGKTAAVQRVVGAVLAGGHVLLEDVPGTGKTMLARALAKSLDAEFRRVQFTPDLLPSDLTGVSVFNQKEQSFRFIAGPLFANVLLADELNRATPRTQSALLEAMEERTISVDGETHPLPAPFIVIATQNPIEQHGVYALPEAQLDRFLARFSLGYASAAEERAMIDAQRESHPIATLEPVVTKAELLAEMKALRTEVTVEPNVADYMVRLAQATRTHRDVSLGGSPRASIALFRMSQAMTRLAGFSFVTPDVVKSVAQAVLAHRLLLRPQSRLGGVKPEAVVEEVLQSVEVPVVRLR